MFMTRNNHDIDAHAYIFGDDESLFLVPDNSDRLSDDMLI